MQVAKYVKKVLISLIILGCITYFIFSMELPFGIVLGKVAVKEREKVYSDALGCNIPFFEVMSPVAQKAFKKVNPPKCERTKPLTRVSGLTLYIDPHVKSGYTSKGHSKFHCCYSYIYRKEQSIHSFNRQADSEIRYGPCTAFEISVNLTSDFVQVECKDGKKEIYKNSHAVITPRLSKKATSCGDNFSDGNPKLSVMLIGLDSLSRLNFQRQMPKTFQLLEELGFIQYFGYNKVADNTYPNLVANLAGRFPEELTCCVNETSALDDGPWIFKNFSDRGYVTFYGEDCPSIGTFTYTKVGFVVQPTDYYYRPFSQAVTRLPRFNNDICFGFQNEIEPLVDYTWDFMNHYQTTPFFGVSWVVRLSHNALNDPQMADPIYYAFFRKLKSSKVLNNTALFFLSDHGLRFGDFRRTYQGRVEERLPTFFARFPVWFEQQFPQAFSNFRDNAYRLTSNFDFHQTLRSLLNVSQLVDPSSIDSGDLRGQSLFTYINVSRTCSDAGINDHWCTCFDHESVPVTAPVIKTVAVFIVNFLNQLLSQVSRCSSLSLDAVLDASLENIPSVMSTDKQQYFLRIRTLPGKAVLESKVTFDSKTKNHAIVGSVSRVNLYGNQSWCVNDPQLKLYCFCK